MIFHSEMFFETSVSLSACGSGQCAMITVRTLAIIRINSLLFYFQTFNARTRSSSRVRRHTARTNPDITMYAVAKYAQLRAKLISTTRHIRRLSVCNDRIYLYVCSGGECKLQFANSFATNVQVRNARGVL